VHSGNSIAFDQELPETGVDHELLEIAALLPEMAIKNCRKSLN
jgi:hypothetical protein